MTEYVDELMNQIFFRSSIIQHHMLIIKISITNNLSAQFDQRDKLEC